jgi:DnaJ-class molecular chaperone
MANYDEIDKARRALGLGETAIIKEIRNAYRRLARLHHPDMQGSADCVIDARMKKLNWAYSTIMDYCKNYSYSFKEEDVARAYPREEYDRKWRQNWFAGF